MKCKDCPFIQEQYDFLAIRLEEDGLVSDEYDDWLYRECYCDKLGGKIGFYGYCGDTSIKSNYVEDTYLPYMPLKDKIKARKRYLNNQRIKNKLKRQAETIKSYPAPSYPVDKDGNYTDIPTDIAYYKKTYKSAHAVRFSYYKKCAHRKVRRNPYFYTQEKGGYKKMFDYKWAIY